MTNQEKKPTWEKFLGSLLETELDSGFEKHKDRFQEKFKTDPSEAIHVYGETVALLQEVERLYEKLREWVTPEAPIENVKTLLANRQAEIVRHTMQSLVRGLRDVKVEAQAVVYETTSRMIAKIAEWEKTA